MGLCDSSSSGASVLLGLESDLLGKAGFAFVIDKPGMR